MEFEANFELNRNNIEFNSAINSQHLQADLIIDYRPSRTSQLINDSEYITLSALIPLRSKILDLQNNKVDKVAGKGLSTNDFTDDFKIKLEGIENGAEVNTVNSVNGQTGNVVIEIPDSATWGNITGTLSNQTDLQQAFNAKQNTILDLADIRSGAQAGATALQPNDNISYLSNDTGYITSSAISNMQTTTNLVTSISSASTDSQYPSAKLFYDMCGDIETLINAL